MKNIRKMATVFAVAGLLLAGVSNASAANKTITCYKGTAVKKVTAANPKCPKGYTTTKPKTATTTTTKGGVVKIDATYKGTITMVWGEADVNVTSVTATGSGSTGGLDTLKGMGAAQPTEQCTMFDGEGTLGSGTDTLKLKFTSDAMACSADADAPTTVTIKKKSSAATNVSIVSGTGKYAGATGSLVLTGKWAIDSAKGTKSTPVTLELVGTITTK